MVLREAERALAEAKRGGRNTILECRNDGPSQPETGNSHQIETSDRRLLMPLSDVEMIHEEWMANAKVGGQESISQGLKPRPFARYKEIQDRSPGYLEADALIHQRLPNV